MAGRLARRDRHTPVGQLPARFRVDPRSRGSDPASLVPECVRSLTSARSAVQRFVLIGHAVHGEFGARARQGGRAEPSPFAGIR